MHAGEIAAQVGAEAISKLLQSHREQLAQKASYLNSFWTLASVASTTLTLADFCEAWTMFPILAESELEVRCHVPWVMLQLWWHPVICCLQTSM
jgi:hypothetical protein